MAISSDTLKVRPFYDEKTEQWVDVELTVRDIIYFKLLEKIAYGVTKN